MVVIAGWCYICYKYIGQLSMKPWYVYPMIGLNGFCKLRPIVPIEIIKIMDFFIFYIIEEVWRCYNNNGAYDRLRAMVYSWDYGLNTITGKDKFEKLFFIKALPIRARKLLKICFCLSINAVLRQNTPPF